MYKKTKESSPLLKDGDSQINDYIYSLEIFPHIEEAIQALREPDFLELSLRKRFRIVNQTLYQLIDKAPSPSFLLKAVLDFFDRVNKENILNEPLDLATFEFWLNHFSGISEQDNYEVRAKISGKFLPREEYQAFFPIGMGKVYAGSHFTAAHLSPDVDTMVASFWGWVDAFSARVGLGLHLWSLPGGPPDSPITGVFQNMFGAGVFSLLAYKAKALTLTARDLVTQKLFTKESGTKLINVIDHGSTDKAVILVNDQGHYLGDWRRSDVELVRQIIILIKACFHWFENHLHTQLISLFAKERVTIQDLSFFTSSIFDISIKDCEPIQDFNETQKNYLKDFFDKVLGVKQGFAGTFRQLNQALALLSVKGMLNVQKELERLSSSKIFDEKGSLRENRPQIFEYLKKLMTQVDEALFEVRTYVERLDVALNIKYKVLGQPYTYITLHSDIEEIRQKMEHRDFLTVIIHEQDGSLFPVGIVRSRDLREQGLGTVALRDFCNLEEVRMAPYLEIISVVDHHKSFLKTLSVPTALIGDVQSCNVLIAEQMFKINDKYSLGGMSIKQIESQIQELNTSKGPDQIRILQRLLQRRLNAGQNHSYYVDAKRESIEYFCFLHAILDDTDLLTKASYRDLECVTQLLNRLKSLSLQKEVELIQLDDLARDENFIRAAALRILQQVDMYSLYKQVYQVREDAVNSQLSLCIQKMPSNIFLDTKEQNGCARVGQTKMFASNIEFFLKHILQVRQIWFDQAQEVFKENPEVDLHLHMISTIASAEEVYKNQIGPYHHQDELWFWTPHTQQGYRHLYSFLAGFQYAVKDLKKEMFLELSHLAPKEYIEIFDYHFPEVPQEISQDCDSLPIAILRFKPGALNSRKSMITPYLPRI